MTANTSTTVVCDYFPPLPTWGFSSNPYKALSTLAETAKIMYKMGIVATKLANMHIPNIRFLQEG